MYANTNGTMDKRPDYQGVLISQVPDHNELNFLAKKSSHIKHTFLVGLVRYNRVFRVVYHFNFFSFNRIFY